MEYVHAGIAKIFSIPNLTSRAQPLAPTRVIAPSAVLILQADTPSAPSRSSRGIPKTVWLDWSSLRSGSTVAAIGGGSLPRIGSTEGWGLEHRCSHCVAELLVGLAHFWRAA